MSCCGGKQRLTAHGCFERGLAGRRLPPLPIAGKRITAANGLWVSFSLQAGDNSCLHDIRFNASTCTTLIAYCQALVELNRCRSVDEAVECGYQALAASLPGVPTAKHDRAILATTAFRAALCATESQSRKREAA